MLGDEVPVVAVIVIELAAHVEAAVGKRVVEQAESCRRLRLPCHVEGDVLVEGIRGACAITHCVDVAHFVGLVRSVERTGALAEADIHFAFATFDVVIHALVPPAKVIRLRLPIAHHALPRRVVQDVPRAESTVQRNRQTDARRFNHNLLSVGRYVKSGWREIAHVAAIAAFERNVVRARRDGPGPRTMRIAVR